MASAIAESASLLHKVISFLSSKASREIHLKKKQDIAIKSLLKEKDVSTCLGLFISSDNKSKSLEYVQTFRKHVVQIREERAVSFNRIIPTRLHKSATTNCWKPSLWQGLKRENYILRTLGAISAKFIGRFDNLGFSPRLSSIYFFRSFWVVHDIRTCE